MRIINLVENEPGESGCEAALNPKAKIYMQQNAGGEYYTFDGEEKGFRYIGIDKKILSLPQVQFLPGDTKIDDELQLFTVDTQAFPLPSTKQAASGALRWRVYSGRVLPRAESAFDIGRKKNPFLRLCA